jgi:hypothetical protein
MFLTNHTLTGVLLGLTVDNPVLLAPTAVASHLVLDMTPHYGPSGDHSLGSRFFYIAGTIDFALSVAVTVGACLLWPQRAVNIIIGVVGADLPDLTYLPIAAFGVARVNRIPGYKAMLAFLARIQWYEKPPGIISELVWFTLIVLLLGAHLPA